MTWQFWAGLAVGSIVTLIALLLAQGATKADVEAKRIKEEDAATDAAKDKENAIDKDKEQAHHDIDDFTEAEMRAVLTGVVSFDELRRRKAAARLAQLTAGSDRGPGDNADSTDAGTDSKK